MLSRLAATRKEVLAETPSGVLAAGRWMHAIWWTLVLSFAAMQILHHCGFNRLTLRSRPQTTAVGTVTEVGQVVTRRFTPVLTLPRMRFAEEQMYTVCFQPHDASGRPLGPTRSQPFVTLPPHVRLNDQVTVHYSPHNPEINIVNDEINRSIVRQSLVSYLIIAGVACLRICSRNLSGGKLYTALLFNSAFGRLLWGNEM